MPELDIDASAREVADLLNRSQTHQAVERLDALRRQGWSCRNRWIVSSRRFP